MIIIRVYKKIDLQQTINKIMKIKNFVFVVTCQSCDIYILNKGIFDPEIHIEN
jgi:hypothetical protein